MEKLLTSGRPWKSCMFPGNPAVRPCLRRRSSIYFQGIPGITMLSVVGNFLERFIQVSPHSVLIRFTNVNIQPVRTAGVSQCESWRGHGPDKCIRPQRPFYDLCRVQIVQIHTRAEIEIFKALMSVDLLRSCSFTEMLGGSAGKIQQNTASKVFSSQACMAV